MSGQASYDSYLIIDFEFTVNNQRVGRPRFFFPEIIEVGAVLLHGSNLQRRKKYQTFVRPRFYPRLTKECSKITLIKQEDVDNGLPLEEMLSKLDNLYEPGKTMVVAWGDADRDVLNKIEEYKCSANIDITDAGRLLGHIVLGVGLVDRYIARVPDFPEVLRLKLLHMIVSHHGQYEWQSPKKPKFLEAAILHKLDMLDAEVNMFSEATDGSEDNEETWNGWVSGLDIYVFCG